MVALARICSHSRGARREAMLRKVRGQVNKFAALSLRRGE
jgi:hypothetical protein